MIEYVLRIFELLVAAFQVSVDIVLLAIMQTRLLNGAHFVRAIIAGHIEVTVDLYVVLWRDLCGPNGQR